MQKKIVLAGNPNVGKTTLFNQLTGSNQKIANYPGVTVEKLTGHYKDSVGNDVAVEDLPGTYSLENLASEDERIAANHIMGEGEGCIRPDVVVVVIEASKLKRGLKFATQILNKHPQVIIALNMFDELSGLGIHINLEKLSQHLKVPVLGLCAKKKEGIDSLKKEIEQYKLIEHNKFCTGQPQKKHNREHIDLNQVNHIVDDVFSRKKKQQLELTDKLDNVFLHPVLGVVVFFAVILVMFQALFSLSVPFMDFIETGMAGLSQFVKNNVTSQIASSFLTDGLIAGVGAVLVFLPQIIITFLLIGFLEMSGYLSRGAFLIDRFMKVFGLEGRSFIPLISSFACAVPGIMSARTIGNHRQRLITMLIAPLMTCSARLPVYTLIIACFIPRKTVWGVFNWQGLTLFLLFVAGIIAALVMALIFDKWLPKKCEGLFLLELPRYRLPTLKAIYSYVAIRVGGFLKKAGTIIVVCSVVLWALAFFPRPDHILLKKDTMGAGLSQTIEQSYLGQLGHMIEPAIKPLGFDWKIGVGLLSAFAAREVFVATMGIVHQVDVNGLATTSLRERIVNATNEDGTKSYSFRMALALLAFFAFACQCVSTLAVLKSETGSLKWPVIVFLYMTVLAYVVALVIYQGLGVFGFR